MDSEAPLHMMSKGDLIWEEQDTIRKSKDPSVTMTANGTIHTIEEATVYCSCLLKFNYWHPGQPSYLIKNWEKHRLV